MMQMTQRRQQQRSETPEKKQLLHDKAATRKRQREAESPDQRERRLERQREYQRAYRRRRQKAVAATEQTVGTSNELVCDSSRKGKSASAKHVATTAEILIEKRAIRLQKKRVRAREVISVESDEHREGRLKRTRQHERDVRSLDSEGQRNSSWRE